MSTELNTQILSWLKEHVTQVKRLAKDGHRPAKAVLDARSLYLRCIDGREQSGARLTHDIHGYIRWLVSPAGKAALERVNGSHTHSDHNRPAPQRQRVEAARPAVRAGGKQSRAGRTLR